MSTTVNLAMLNPGDSGTITSVHTHDRILHYRLEALGFRIGKRVEVIRHARFAGPVHIRIGTTDIMMRRKEAQQIEVQINQ